MTCFVLICLATYLKAHRKERKLITGSNMCHLKPLKLAKINDSRCRIEGELPVIYGCMGYCRSATITLTDRLGFVPNCQCCRPTLQATVNASLVCQHAGIVRRIPIITAVRCHCRKCWRSEQYSSSRGAPWSQGLLLMSRLTNFMEALSTYDWWKLVAGRLALDINPFV